MLRTYTSVFLVNFGIITVFNQLGIGLLITVGAISIFTGLYIMLVDIVREPLQICAYYLARMSK